MGEVINLKEEGEWKIPTNDGEVVNTDLADGVDGLKKSGEPKFEFFEKEDGYISPSIVSGDAENEIIDFRKAHASMESLRFWLENKDKKNARGSLRKAA